MFILYHKRLHIVKESLTRNQTHQTWRGKQVAMCESRKPLDDYINSRPKREQKSYYIEEQPIR